jgi:UDP-N-acetylglucosamine 1-carboxyvinyltransferase
MDEMVIHGGRPLSGAVHIHGAKNAALPIMAASLLTEGPTVLHRVPRLRDVETIAGILNSLGVTTRWVGPQTLRLVPHWSAAYVARFDLVRQMRGSVCVLGPLLATRGAAVLPQPGGCVLGERPIDLHLKGLRGLGAVIQAGAPCIYARADRLRGARVSLAGPHGSTVTGTANVLMAATLAEGRTVIEGAACEPETQDLAAYLSACGARIGGIGTRTLTVDGVKRLRGVEHSIIPDRIEAGTLAAAAAATGGEVTLEGVRPDHMEATLEALERAGAECRVEGDSITVRRTGPLRPVNLVTAPYPGFPTDMHPQLSALLCLARGRSTIRETIYPERFTYAGELSRMGARIARADATAVVEGPAPLHGAAVRATDLRAGAALVVAALAACGQTILSGVDQVDRGHQCLEERLGALGADICRRHAEPAERSEKKSA